MTTTTTICFGEKITVARKRKWWLIMIISVPPNTVASRPHELWVDRGRFGAIKSFYWQSTASGQVFYQAGVITHHHRQSMWWCVEVPSHLDMVLHLHQLPDILINWKCGWMTTTPSRIGVVMANNNNNNIASTTWDRTELMYVFVNLQKLIVPFLASLHSWRCAILTVILPFVISICDPSHLL